MAIGTYLSVHTELSKPTCLAFAGRPRQPTGRKSMRGNYAVGMTNGAVLLFSDQGKPTGHIMETASAEAYVACTAVDMLSTGEVVAAAYLVTGAQPKIVLYDVDSDKVHCTFDLSKRASKIKLLGSRDYVASLEDDGCLKVHGRLKAKTFSVQIGDGIKDFAHTVVERDTDGHDPQERHVVICAATRLHAKVYVVRCSGGHPVPVEQPVLVVENTDSQEPLPIERKHSRQRRQGAEEQRRLAAEARKKADPSVSWLPRECAGGSGLHLAVLWLDNLYICEVNSRKCVDAAEYRTVRNVGSVSPVVVLPLGSSVACYVADRAVLCFTTGGHVTIVDPRLALEGSSAVDSTVSCNPVVDTEPMEQGTLMSALSANCAVYALQKRQRQAGAQVKVTKVEVLNWRQVLLSQPTTTQQTLWHALHLKRNKARAGVGLPRSQEERDREVGSAIDRLVNLYVIESVSSAPSDMCASDQQAWWRRLGEFLFDYLTQADFPSPLFGVVYDHFARVDLVGSVWALLVEQQILAGRLRAVPDHVLELLTELFIRDAVLALHRPQEESFQKKQQRHVDVTTACCAAHNPPQFVVEAVATPDFAPNQERCVLCCVEVDPPSGYELLCSEAGRWAVRVGTGESRCMVEGPAVSRGKTVKLSGVFKRLEDSDDDDFVHSGILTLYVNGAAACSAETLYRRNTLGPLRIGAGVSPTRGGVLVGAQHWIGDVSGVKVYSSTHDVDGGGVRREQLWKHHDLAPDEPFTPIVLQTVLEVDSASDSSEDGRDMFDATQVVTPQRRRAGALTDQSLSRLEKVLLQMSYEGCAGIGADYSKLMNVAEEYWLFHALASLHNKHPPAGADCYIAPLNLLHRRGVAAMVGSKVAWESEDGSSGAEGEITVVGPDGECDVDWHTQPRPQQQVVLSSLKVLPNSKANEKPKKVFLSYLRLILAGRTFHGEEIPKDLLLPVRVRALEFLFGEQTDGGSTDTVLDQFLRFDAGAVLLALQSAWYDESMYTSPWPKVLQQPDGADKGQQVSPRLVKAVDSDSRFRMSRDQVVAVLNRKLEFLQGAPFDAESTKERAWPEWQHVVAYCKHLARSIAAGCIDPAKFDRKGGAFVKRIFGHLSYRCPKHIAERTERQSLLEGMLSAALLPEKGVWTEQQRQPDGRLKEEEMLELINAASVAAFSRLLVFLHRADNNYHQVLNTYLFAQGTPGNCVVTADVFDFLEDVLTSTQTGTCSQAVRKSVEALGAAIIDYLEKLVEINSQRTADLIVRHFSGEHTRVLKKLDAFPRTQFAYMKSLIWAATRAEEADDEDVCEGKLPPALRDPAHVELYITRLCQYEPAELQDFLHANEGVVPDLARVLAIITRCKKAAATAADPLQGKKEREMMDSAVVYLQSRLGHFEEALELLFVRLRSGMMSMRECVIDYVARTHIEGGTPGMSETLQLGSVMLSLSRDASRSHGQWDRSRMRSQLNYRSRAERRGSKDSRGERRSSLSTHRTTNCEWLETILTSSAGRGVNELLEVGIRMCLDSMRGGGDVTRVWFTLLEKFTKPKKILAEAEQESRTWAALEMGTCMCALTAVCASTRVYRRLCGSAAAAGDTQLPATPAQWLSQPAPVLPVIQSIHVLEPVTAAIDELEEVLKREETRKGRDEYSRTVRARERGPGTARGRLQKMLSCSMTPVQYAVNSRMFDVYSHFVNSILMRMIEAKQATQLNQQETAQLSLLRDKVLEMGAQWREAVRSSSADVDDLHLAYLTAKEKFMKATQRIENIIMNKVIEDPRHGGYADSTLGEFVDVLTVILENTKFEKNLQRSFYKCLGAGIHGLETDYMIVRTCALRQKRTLWHGECAACSGRLHDGQHTLCFQCGHFFHCACAGGLEVTECPLCCKKQMVRSGTQPDQSAPTKPNKKKSSKRRELDRRLDKMRFSNNNLLLFREALIHTPEDQGMCMVRPPVLHPRGGPNSWSTVYAFEYPNEDDMGDGDYFEPEVLDVFADYGEELEDLVEPTDILDEAVSTDDLGLSPCCAGLVGERHVFRLRRAAEDDGAADRAVADAE
eukprot:TRINITY_DN17621_c0_g2_i1.p1 TRINITY_DN17621_c0_g2~~TRINITY_DN17621_c0_g2_i1.p1  ORF type:complete len:2310 (+),score=431.26 TRINITY_DN17621_c0_g2_i1:805-6930(+)